MLITFRFLNNLVIISLTLEPNIISDLFIEEERGSAMALAIVFPLTGPVAAPIFGGYTAQAKGVRHFISLYISVLIFFWIGRLLWGGLALFLS